MLGAALDYAARGCAVFPCKPDKTPDTRHGVDDASTDGTADAARAAGDGSGRLKVLTQPLNAGTSAARNRGIAESTAPWIGVLDSDDFFLPGRLAGEMQCEGRRADAAFPTEGRDDHHRFPLAVFHRRAPRPTSERLDSCMLDSKLGGSEVAEFPPENAASGS